MTTRRAFLGALASGLLAAPLAAGAQQAGKVYRVGILAPNASPALQAFRDALGNLGYIEGQNLIVEARYDEGNPARLPALAADLVKLRVDVIVAATSTYVRAAKEATTSIPIVFAAHNDPIGTGDVVSLAHPGGNVTGLTLMATDLTSKQLEFLREAVPALRRLVVVWNPSTPSHKPSLPEAIASGRRLGMDVHLQEAANVSEFERAYEAAAQWRADAVLILTSPVSFVVRRKLAELAVQHRLPTMHGFKEYVEAGGLISYAPDLTDLARRAANYVTKVLQGAKPADLPVEQPLKFELVINLKTARALGLTISPSLLLRAHQVIE